MPVVKPNWSVTLKARDMPRPFLPVGDTKTTDPWIIQNKLGQLHRVFSDKGSIRYMRSDSSVPPYTTDVYVTTINETGLTRDDRSPCIAQTMHGKLIVLFERVNVRLEQFGYTFDIHANVWESESNDDGETWSEPVMAFRHGRHPIVVVQPGTGTILRAAYVDGKIQATIQYSGEARQSEPFYFSDGKFDIEVLLDSFCVAAAVDGQQRWLLSVRCAAEPGTSDWVSYDDCRTWKRTDDVPEENSE